MPDLEKQIAEWRAEMTRSGIRNPEVLDELEAHLRERANRLLAAEVSEPEAFQTAVRELGEGAELKREFAKVAYTGLWAWRNNPLPLNLLALWFTIRGLEFLIQASHFFAHTFSFPNVLFIDWHGLTHCAWTILWSMWFLLMGVGLYRRRNAWRICALGWSAWMLIGAAVTYMLSPSHLHLPHTTSPRGFPINFEILGLSVSYWVFCAYLYLSYPVLLGAVYYLSKPSTGNFFRPSTKVQTA